MKNEIIHQATILRNLAEKVLKGRAKKTVLNLSSLDTLKLIHELEVHQIELEMQNEELKTINLEMGISQRATIKYTNLYDYAPNGYFTLTREGEIIDLNQNAAQKLGIEPTLVTKKKFGFFVSEETRPLFNYFMEQVYELKTKVTCQLVLVSKSNISIHVQLTGLLFEEKGWCFLSVTDITERILQEQHREITRTILQLLNEPGNIKETVHNALRELKKFTGYDTIGIRMREGEDFPYFDQIGFSKEFLKADNTLLEYDSSGEVCRDKAGNPILACTCGQVISGVTEPTHPLMMAGGSWWVNDSAKGDVLNHSRNRCLQQGFSSIALIPIRHNASIIGLLQFNDHLKDRFTKPIVEYLEEIASHIGSAILRKQAEDKLIQSEARYRTLFNSIVSAFCVVEMIYDTEMKPVDYRFLETNALFEAQTGLVDAKGKFMREMRPEHEAYWYEIYGKIALTGELMRFEKEARALNRWYDVCAFPEGEPGSHRVAISFNDITPRKRAEVSLAQSEERYHTLFNSMIEGFCIIDVIFDARNQAVDYLFLEANSNYEEQSGLSDVVGKRARTITPDLEQYWFDMYGKIVLTGELMRFENESKALNKWFEVCAFRYGGAGSSQVAVCFSDITERRRVERALQNSKKNFSDICTSMTDGISFNEMIYDATGKAIDYVLVDANPAFEKITNQKLCDVIGMKGSERYLMEKAPYFDEYAQVASTGKPMSLEIYFPPLDKYLSISAFSPGKGKFVSMFRDITEARQVERALFESNEQYRLLFENSGEGILLTQFDGSVYSANPEACIMFGRSEDEIKELARDGLSDPNDPRILRAMIARNRTGSFKGELNYLRNDGTPFPVEVSSMIFKDTTGKERISTFFRDISERKQIEEEIAIKNSRLKLAMQAGNMAWWEMDIPTGNVVFDFHKTEMLGYHPEDFTNYRDFMALVHPDDAERCMTAMRDHYTGLTDRYAIEYRILSQSGDYIWCSDIGTITRRDAAGRPLSITGLAFNIDGRKKAEEEILINNARLTLAMEVSNMAWWEMDIATGAISFEKRKAEMLGYNPKDFKHYEDFMRMVHPEDAEKAMEAMRQHMYGSADKYEVEYRIKANNGEYKWFYDIGSITQRDSTGKAILATGLVINITERKKGEEALRLSEEKFRNLVWGMQVGVLLFTPDSEIVPCNPKALELLGIDDTRLQEVPLSFQDMDVIHEDGSLFLFEDQPVARVMTTGVGVSDCIMGVLNASTGKRNWIQVQAEPQVGQEGKIEQVLSTFIDISEQKIKDELLKKLNKTLSALSKSSQAMVHSLDEADYMNQVCTIVKEDCGYAMVWIGFAGENGAKSVNPVASAGFEYGYLETIMLSWGDNDYGRGPTGSAIRTMKTHICRNMSTDPTFIPWRKSALERGYASSISIPLLNGKNAFGALTIYSRELDAFPDDEVQLLNALSIDLSYGITAIRLRVAHQEAQEALSKSYEKLEELVLIRTRALEVTNKQLNAEIKISIQQEQHLKSAEEKYRTVADFTYNMETWIDTQGHYIYVSPSCKITTGYTVEEFMNDSSLFVNIAHPDDKKRVEEHFKEKTQGHLSNCTLDFRIITPQGEERWLGHSCQKVFDGQGNWIGQRGSNRNITLQKNAELVLVESEKHLRALTHRMDVVTEEERIRISRDIHDELGHLLTAVKYDVEGLINKPMVTIKYVKSELKALNSMIDSLIDSVRKIATELRPGILDHLGLFPAIEWQIKEFMMKSKICCEYNIEEMDLEFNKNETTFIYRILQEILTNVSRYSKAKDLWISIYRSEGYFIMKIKDNGIGFEYNENQQKGSLGLLGMHERALFIGGEMHIESAPGQGTTASFTIKK